MDHELTGDSNSNYQHRFGPTKSSALMNINNILEMFIVVSFEAVCRSYFIHDS